MIQKPPVLILAFQRPESVMEICQTSKVAGVERIYISIDGPTSILIYEKQKQLMSKLLDFEQSNSDINILIQRAEKNQGLVRAILRGIDWVFENEECAIILEEDLSPNVDFFHYCEFGLNKYENFREVLSLSGNNFSPSGNNIIHASHYPLIWGWATWKNRWLPARQCLVGPKVFSSWISGFTSKSGFWNAGLIRVRFTLLQSWALPFAAYSFKNRYLNLLPPRNLVGNLGFDELATHTFSSSDRSYGITSGMPPETFFPDALSDFNLVDSQIEKTFYKMSYWHIISPLWAVAQVLILAFKRGGAFEK